MTARTGKGKMETTADRTPRHMAATLTATRGTPGLVAIGAVCNDTSRWRRQRVVAFRRWFAARPSSAAVLREALTTYLTANDIDDAVTRLIVLCADEALINAVAHAPGSPVGVFADLHDDHFTLEVSDGGPGFDPSQNDSDAEPDLMGEHGRGLFLIRNFMDDLEILSDEHGTTLRMERDLPGVVSRAPDDAIIGIALHTQRHVMPGMHEERQEIEAEPREGPSGRHE